jgi:hypothetical protein
MVLNRRLPRITARDLLPIAPFRGHFPSCPDNLTRVEPFAGAARLTRFPVMCARRDKYREVFQVRPKAAPLQVLGTDAAMVRTANYKLLTADR